MELLKPIFVKRWVTENKYIEYVFDNNPNNNYKSAIVLKEYIFRDINIKETIDKLAYHIFNYENKLSGNISYPYYAWSSINNVEQPILFNIKKIVWKGYHENPFKSNNRDSQQLKEPIEYLYNEDTLNIDKINIVFYNDFKYDIKYYYPDNKQTINLNKKLEDSTIVLYRSELIKTKEKKEEYFDISFSYKYEIDSLIVLFDNLKTTDNMQLIQLINNNNAVYKINKNHTIEDRELSKIFNLDKKDEGINIYYKNEKIKLNISKDGVFTIYIKPHMDKGENISVINKIKNEIVEYLKSYFKINTEDFKINNINSRITYSIDYADISLIKKIGTYANIFQDYEKIKDNNKKNNGNYIYKRTDNIDIENYIRNRKNYRKISTDEILKELRNIGINKTANDVNEIIKNMDEMEIYKLNKQNNKELNSTIDVIVNADNIEIVTNNFKSFFELENLKYWLIRIIENSRIAKPPKAKKDSPKKKNSPIITKKSSSSSKKSSKSSSSKNKDTSDSSGSSDSSYSIKSDEVARSDSSYGGGKNKEHYLINKLKIADKELWNGDNPPRRCQRPKQPVVLTESEMEELKKYGKEKILDNIIKHGSNNDNLNYYTCPRIWCPISNIPLDESIPKKDLKCPDDNEEPIMMNEIMKNSNNPRYAYIINKHNLPCCGNKDPELKKKSINKVENVTDIAIKGKRGRKAKPKKDAIYEIQSDNSDNSHNSDHNVANKSKDKEEINAVSNNYIMTQVPVIFKNRYGNIRKELYNVLYDDYKEYMANCVNRNNINKHNCTLRKGLKDIAASNKKFNNYDNIIDVVAFLLNKSRDGLIKDIEKKLDIILFLSLENGNVFKDFADNEPVIPEKNEELYIEFLNKFDNKLLSFPKIEENFKKALYKKSRLLYIYNAYKKFINYLKSTDSKYDKNIQYIFSLVAILYKKLIISWEIEKGTDNGVQIICPYYTNVNDLIPYLGKTPKMIMIYKDNNNDKDNINNPIYEPLVSKSINSASDIKHYNLDEHENIKNILNKCSDNINYNNIDLYDNRQNIKAIIRRVNNKENLSISSNSSNSGNSDKLGSIYGFKTLIINRDLSIDKIILNNNIIIKFKKQSIIIINLLIEFFNIKNVVFSEDIIDQEYTITIKKDIHKEFEDDAKLLGINIEKFEIIKETKNNIRGKIKFTDYDLDDNVLLNSDYFNKYHKYVNKNDETIKRMYEIRKYIKGKLLNSRYTDEYYNKLSKNSRTHIINTLLEDVIGYDKYSKRELQIILEEIDLYSIKSIKKWYSLSLGNFKYDYINDISENIIETDSELIFSQYIISNNIPKNIISYKDYYPNNINDVKNPIDKVYNIKYELKNNIVKNIPKIFKGIEIELNSKWKKYTKKIWSKLRYIKVEYDKNYIKELYEFLINYDKKLITNIYKYNDIINYTYDEYESILCNNLNSSDAKRKNNKLIEQLFKDPHFYNVYINSMNVINNSNKNFKTLKAFFETYFNNSEIEERRYIIHHIKQENPIKYFGDVTLKLISKWLNINIFIIYERLEYGKGVDIEKRAGNKDLNLTSAFYRAGTKKNNILKRPLIMLYRKKNKTNNISYYLIKVNESNTYIYNELDDAPDEIKNKLINLKYDSNDSILSGSK
jgi:hypothetical protein